jgi:phosphatidylglycerophosphate synthase
MIALGLVALVLITMPVFAIVSRGRPLDADVARRPTTIILGTWVRDWLMWFIRPLEQGMVRAGVSPDALNFTGAILGGAAGVAFAFGQLAVGGWFVLLGGVADIFDGRIARSRGIASERGAFLDSTLDRFAETFAFVGLVAFYSASRWAAGVIAIALGASMLVSYTRARGEALGVECKGGVMQRAERLVLLGLSGILDGPVSGAFGWAQGTLMVWTVAVIAVGALGTAIYRTAVIARQLGSRGG